MLDGTDEVEPSRRRADGGDADEGHRCAECGKTFDTLPSLRGHAGGTGHDIHGRTRQSPRRFARRLKTALNGLTPRDPDDDGDYDVPPQAWAGLMVGIIVGHTLAHDPTLLEENAVRILIGLATGAASSIPRKSPVKPEWLIGATIRMALVGIAFGILLVTVPFDQLVHQFGAHAHG
ncbi:hypothetical protein C2R22_06030 [Salinigranum rubrum]|uniref:C2H2-type domain-containing protein n=1 Tax=Salinigranum rubrum TaxID=755307 RepID=A0A2I8VH74_9EURY|nr:C2H2-type zinc finger protein [Salinigranum rubrum]AUV81277.1 hypothetical protein C2R22_06030 [Salinigranum rubrum]